LRRAEIIEMVEVDSPIVTRREKDGKPFSIDSPTFPFLQNQKPSQISSRVILTGRG
jgi:hypothetical protein